MTHQTASSEQLGTSITGSLPLEKPQDLEMSFDGLNPIAINPVPDIAISCADDKFMASNTLPRSYSSAVPSFRPQPSQYHREAVRNLYTHGDFLDPAATQGSLMLGRRHSTGGAPESILAHRHAQTAANTETRRVRKRARPVVSQMYIASHGASTRSPALSEELTLSASLMNLPPGGANILEGWLEQEAAKGSLPSIPEGQVLWKLAGDTGTEPASVQAWVSQRIGEPPDNNRTSGVSYNPPTIKEIRLIPCGTMLRKLEKFIEDRESKPCPAGSTSTGTRYHCSNYPNCDACFDKPGGWRRHQDIRFPCEFFLCIQCGEIFDRHVREHLTGTEGVDSDRWQEFKVELDYDPDGVEQRCTFQPCDRTFRGKRKAMWNELQEHMFNDHVKHYVSQEPVALPPSSRTGGPGDPHVGEGGGGSSSYDYDRHNAFGGGPAHQ